MKYIVLKTFKCRYTDFKVYHQGDYYKSVNKEHTEKLIKLGFIKAVEEKKKPAAKKPEKKKADAK